MYMDIYPTVDKIVTQINLTKMLLVQQIPLIITFIALVMIFWRYCFAESDASNHLKLLFKIQIEINLR